MVLIGGVNVLRHVQFVSFAAVAVVVDLDLDGDVPVRSEPAPAEVG